MTTASRKAPGAGGLATSFVTPSARPAAAVQLRGAAIARDVRRPVPPPAYHPQRQSTVQAKLSAAAAVAATAVRPKAPVAPPAFRAPPARTAVQAKMVHPFQKQIQAPVPPPRAPQHQGAIVQRQRSGPAGRIVKSGLPAACVVQRASPDPFDMVDQFHRADHDSDSVPSANVSFKIKHKHLGRLEVKGNTTDSPLSLDDFAKQGRQVVSCSYLGPRGTDRTHYEIICQIRGLYGKTKYIKFHFTSAGYFAIYNATPGGDGLQTYASAAPLGAMDTSEKLYAEFLRLSAQNGPYRSEVYTCQNFAREFYYNVTGQKVDGYDPDSDW